MKNPNDITHVYIIDLIGHSILGVFMGMSLGFLPYLGGGGWGKTGEFNIMVSRLSIVAPHFLEVVFYETQTLSKGL